MNPLFRAAMMRADAAIKLRDRAGAAQALHEALAVSADPPSEETALRAMPMLQATFMATLAGDVPLAQQLAVKVLSEAVPELHALCSDYQDTSGKPLTLRAATCFAAANHVVAFIPFVQQHPWISWDDLQFLGASGEVGASVRAMLKNMRPQLDRLGWAAWPYPAELVNAAHYWSARALTDWGRMCVDNVESGKEVQNAQALAEVSLTLIKDLPEDQLTADALNLLGRAFLAYGDPSLTRDKAVHCFSECIRILDAIGNHDDAAIDRGNLGAIYIGLAEFAAVNAGAVDAETFYVQAEQLITSAVEVHRTCKFPEHLPNALLNLGSLQMAREKWAEAAAVYADVLETEQKKPARGAFVEIAASAHLGSTLLRLGPTRLAEAEQHLRRAVALIQIPGAPLSNAETAALAYGGLGDALRRQAKPKDATAYLATAIARLEQFGASFFSERPKSALFKTFRWIYEAMIDCCATLAVAEPEQAALAFNLAERIKWRTLTEALRYMPLRFPGMETEPLLNEETELLGRLFSSAIGSPGDRRSAFDIDAATKRVEQIWATLEQKYPEYVAIRRQNTVEASEAKSWLDEQVPTLVEYYLGDEFETAIAFVLKKDQAWPAVVRLPCTPASLATQILELRPKPDHEFPSAKAFNTASEALHRCLIAPILEMLPEATGVCIAPCGSLHNLPFAALFDGQRYLIERNAIVITPCVTGLRWWRAIRQRPAPESCLIAAFSTRSGVGENLNEFSRLARKQIARLFLRSTLVVSKDATKETLRTAINEGDGEHWDVIHIACHGNCLEDGLQSYLEVQPSPDNENGAWTALEIFTEVRTSTTLITLSACDSGIAQTTTNDEIAGLAQAFLFCGASSVLGSLWRVQQGMGVRVTHDFYQIWTARRPGVPPCSKIVALQRALQAHLSRTTWLGFRRIPENPYLWATFQLYGDWR